VSHPRSSRNSTSLAALLFLMAVATTLFSTPNIGGEEKKAPDPWPPSQILQASDLARELTDKSVTLPTVVYVGFHTLFAGGHIPGASFHGTASNSQGLADMEKWADTLPRSTNLVIYCGCCPFDHCPNIRPAYTAFNKMGFKKLRVLVLPANFATDWVDKGYPIQKGM
jgi:thiosulfate/3-mercaptopyruvate sulfurtransferase